MNVRTGHQVAQVSDIPPVINQQKPTPRHLLYMFTSKDHRMSASRIRL